MYLDKEKVKTLMREKADNNYHEFARQLGVDVAQVYRVLNKGSKAGPKFLGRLMRYCQNNGLDFKYYIFLDEPLHVCNTESNTSAQPTGTDGN